MDIIKIETEIAKLMAETSKLNAEAAKMIHEYAWYFMALIAVVFTPNAALARSGTGNGAHPRADHINVANTVRAT